MLEFVMAGASGSVVVTVTGNVHPPDGWTGNFHSGAIPLAVYVGAAGLSAMPTYTTIFGEPPASSGEFTATGTVPVSGGTGLQSLYLDWPPTEIGSYGVALFTVDAVIQAVPFRVKPNTRRTAFS